MAKGKNTRTTITEGRTECKQMKNPSHWRLYEEFPNGVKTYIGTIRTDGVGRFAPYFRTVRGISFFTNHLYTIARIMSKIEGDER